jgi:CRP-like cAMP-binding protein
MKPSQLSTQSLSAACFDSTQNVLSDIHSSSLFVTCNGKNCYILGGMAYFEEVLCFKVANAQVFYTIVSAIGHSSIASGAIFGIAASNFSIFSGIRSVQSNISADGSLSQALGGFLSVLSGSISLTNCTLLQSAVRCLGQSCSASGGFLSALSTLIYNSNYNNLVTIEFCSLNFGTVTCHGHGCSASGGAIAAGTSYRASNWINTAVPLLTDSVPPSMRLHLRNCMIADNMASSSSESASAKGGAMAVQSSVATILNSTFERNSILSGNLVSFAGGGALHIAMAGCIVTAEDCSFLYNNASEVGQGGAILASFGSKFVGSDLTISRNYANRGGAVLIDGAEFQMLNSKIQNNSAWSSGGGMFCSSSQSNYFYATRGLSGVTGISTITLKNVKFFSNAVVDPRALGVGADLFVIGSVILSADNNSEIWMDGNFDRDVTAAVVSVVSNSPNISFKLSCRSGTMLRIAPTALSNLVSLSNPPSMASMLASKCFPACSEVSFYEEYRATSGFLASCTPCPRGTYSFGVSNQTSDTVSSYCRACPFGAVCRGGDAVISQKLHWGWKDSENSAASRFLLLKNGYGCLTCTSMTSCAGRRDGILCGGCEVGYSLALFQTECVPNSQCQMWKAGVVVGMCIVYQLLFSLFLFWSVESELLEKKFQEIFEKESALLGVPVFQTLDKDQVRRASFNVVDYEFAPNTTALSQGLFSDHMFVIREGVFDVFLKPAEGLERKVGELRAPQYFGEMSFLGNIPCLATVRAASHCKVWKINRSCLNDINDAAVWSFLDKRSQEYTSGIHQIRTVRSAKTSLYESFDVLLWFYQLAGIMLTMSSPFDYLDGSAVAYSIVSFILNTRPSTDSVSSMSSAAMGETSIGLDALSKKFAFCFFEDSNAAHIFAATFMYYICWALLISFLSRGRSWSHVRQIIVFLLKSLVRPFTNFERARDYSAFLDERLASVIQIQGAVLLRWCITCFSAISILMLQGTQCVLIRGIGAPGGDLRWLYDGRVACFSDEGQVSGTWQIGSAIGVVISLLAPALLMVAMMRIVAVEPDARPELYSISLTAYSSPFVEGAFHWTVVMYAMMLAES